MNSVLRAHIKKGKFHHGYLLVGDFDISREMAFEAAEAILLDKGEPFVPKGSPLGLQSHPDFFYQTFKLFGIKDSHDLRQRASLKPFLGNSKVFVIEILSFSIESANALLKTFEEPYERTHFFVITSSLEDVLPTLRSRLMIIDNSKKGKEITNEKKEFYNKFLADLPAGRLELIKNISQDKEKAIEFLNELEVVLLGHSVSTWTPNVQVLNQIQKCHDFLYQKGGSSKMVLEHLALILP